jgi:hypothetical protein
MPCGLSTHSSRGKPLGGVEAKQLLDKIHAFLSHRGDVGPPISLRVARHVVIIGQLRVTLVRNQLRISSVTHRPFSLSRRPHHHECSSQLVDIRLSWQERRSPNELKEDGAHRPDVDSSRVMSASPQQLRRSIPSTVRMEPEPNPAYSQCYDLTGHATARFAELPGQTKIGNLEFAMC